jgi:cation-transporting P-type ATPase C
LIRAAETSGHVPAVPEAVPEIFLGRGVRTSLGSDLMTVGNGRFMTEQGIDYQAFQPVAADLEKSGQTVVYVARNGKVIGLVGISYEIRGDLEKLVKTLRREGVNRFHLISGDNAQVVKSLADSFQFDGYGGDLLPEEKATYVENLIGQGHTVAVIGDGINDALALAKASVGVAMGAGGSEAAIAAADIALADDDLGRLLVVRRLSQQTVRVINQNYWLAVGTDLAGSVLGLMGLLSPVLGGLLHVSHALAITANSGRLLTWEPARTG